MDKKIAGLLGAAAALVTVGGANATGVQGNPAESGLSYRDLLNPVPNAVEALKAADAQRDSARGTQVAQVVIGVGHHHHHHHHHHYRVVPHVRIIPRHHHHHHHHHHSMYYGR